MAMQYDIVQQCTELRRLLLAWKNGSGGSITHLIIAGPINADKSRTIATVGLYEHPLVQGSNPSGRTNVIVTPLPDDDVIDILHQHRASFPGEVMIVDMTHYYWEVECLLCGTFKPLQDACGYKKIAQAEQALRGQQ